MEYIQIKRGIDFVFSLLAIIVSCPVWIVTVLILFFANKNGIRGIFFTQQRPGWNEKIFKVLKFKTMTDEKDTDGNLLPDEQRLTGIGKFIRSTSIDELPQLINILKGDMSFIGPRPLLVQYLPLYSPKQHRRHEVRPGLSGWAQVNGRNSISWCKKFELDVWYVDNISLSLDWKIFWLTVKKVFARQDISSSTSATMELFTGEN